MVTVLYITGKCITRRIHERIRKKNRNETEQRKSVHGSLVTAISIAAQFNSSVSPKNNDQKSNCNYCSENQEHANNNISTVVDTTVTSIQDSSDLKYDLEVVSTIENNNADTAGLETKHRHISSSANSLMPIDSRSPENSLENIS